MTDVKLTREQVEEIAKLMKPPVAYLSQQHFMEPTPITCKWCGSKDIKKYGIPC